MTAKFIAFWFVVSIAIAGAPAEQSLPKAACDVLRGEVKKLPAGFFHQQCEPAGNPACPLGPILNAAAWTARADGIGLSRKEQGNHVLSPAGKIAADVLMLSSGIYFDVFSDVDGPGFSINCGGPNGTITDPARGWVAPVNPGTTPPPTPPPPTCADCERALDLARRELVQVRDEVNARDNRIAVLEQERDAASADRDAVRRELEELKARPAGRCEVTGGSGWIRSALGIKCRIVP